MWYPLILHIAFQFKDFEYVNDNYVVSIQKTTSNNNDIIDADFSFKMKTSFYCKSSLTTNTISLVPIYSTSMLGKCLAGVG